MPPTKKPTRGRPPTTRAPILKAARAAFLAHGFEAVTMDLIAEKAGVARTSLYNQFATKEDVFRAVESEVRIELHGRLVQEVESTADPVRALTTLGDALAEYWADPETIAFHRLLITESPKFGWMRRRRAEYDREVLERFERGLRRQMELGTLDCPDPRLAATQFLSLLSGVLLWPRIWGTESLYPQTPRVVVHEAIEMLLSRYGTR